MLSILRSWTNAKSDRIAVLEREIAIHQLTIDQHVATIKQINEKLHALSMKEQEKQDHDYQLIMAQQSLMAEFKDFDLEFPPIFEAVRQFTMTSTERLYALFKAVQYTVRAGILGDVIETGVWRGGSMMLTANVLRQLGDTSRMLHLFDTFEGHPKPDPDKDVDLWGNDAHTDWLKYRITDETSTWAHVSIDEVRNNMLQTGYPADRVTLIKGMVEKTAATNAPERVALLRLDTDWYESTKISLEVFYPRLVSGGVLIIDDYGHYRGQRQAVDEYFKEDRTAPLLNRIDYSCRIGVKP